MGVSLQEVIESSGYMLNKYDDALWLVSKQVEFQHLIEEAEKLIEQCENDIF